MNTEKYDDSDLLGRRRFQKLGFVLSLEKLGQTFFAVIVTKTPLLMGFLVYELNCQNKNLYGLSSERLVDIKIIKLYVEKVVPSTRKI
jgi:hypothetical protein